MLFHRLVASISQNAGVWRARLNRCSGHEQTATPPRENAGVNRTKICKYKRRKSKRATNETTHAQAKLLIRTQDGAIVHQPNHDFGKVSVMFYYIGTHPK